MAMLLLDEIEEEAMLMVFMELVEDFFTVVLLLTVLVEVEVEVMDLVLDTDFDDCKGNDIDVMISDNAKGGFLLRKIEVIVEAKCKCGLKYWLSVVVLFLHSVCYISGLHIAEQY